MPSGYYADHLKPLLCSYFRENERMRATAVSFFFPFKSKIQNWVRGSSFQKRMEIQYLHWSTCYRNMLKLQHI